MLHKTRGIVLNKVKYSETSLIVKIYTELFGLQSYLIRGIRNKKSKIKPSLLQHLALIELIVYHKEKKSIQHIKEIKSAYQFKSVPFDIRKSSIIIFLNEILYKVIKEEESNKSLFEFLFNTIQILDINEKGVSDFHLIFLVQLTKFLGFFPKNNFSKTRDNFNLEDGEF
ncbi:MAG: DNA repair protein RecO [Bacteroidales bacterium]|nr:DNA repair protein RecO [Bacteroidales bacterium]